ncbi:MAG TPA: hypothetical protein VNR18_09375 [Hyphomicrobiales bacterium]|nr:hypothetical protein [Hyphomicrobiales bacterium]
MMPRSALLLGCCVLSTSVLAQLPPAITDSEGLAAELTELDSQFILSRLIDYDFEQLCSDRQRVVEPPRNDFRRLEFFRGDTHISLVVQPDVMRSNFAVFYVEDAPGYLTYAKCQTLQILPVLAIVATATITEDAASVATRQEVMAQNSALTGYEPTRLMARSDSDDISDYYMDFTVSVKHPLFQNSMLLNRAYSAVSKGVDKLTGEENGLFIQPYFSFTGRFSQYIGSRESAPVVARRFNPTLFVRTWSSSGSYMDVGLAHESNGQQIDTQASYQRAVQAYLDAGEPQLRAEAYARDGISRGWDYSFVEWRKEWDLRLATRVQLRHYLSDGPFQHGIEDYATWEDDGYRNRPRQQYDGITLAFDYDFGGSRCLSGNSFICFQRLTLSQDTGYSNPFDNTTTTLELTSNFFGLPIQLWTRSGYNSDLVDYYNYSHSWGVGIELLGR